MRLGIIGALGLVLAASSGCYSVRKSSGGGQIEFSGVRAVDPSDVALPDGYRIEVVARDLTVVAHAIPDELRALAVRAIAS